MALTSGSRLGPYEIVGALGAGGMGEVYRARDTKLDRSVAIKILPESLAQDPDRLARFEREAKTLAALNHPNIAIVHGFEEATGVQALVMELVEGPTLAERIAHSPIPVSEALPIARQIADALESAHEQGIVHRDLKPANIKLRPDGTVKVLDFGLAKALSGDASATVASPMSYSPTITSPAGLTVAGTLLGTAAYMAPEQARGRPLDRRADIWAFGCVLFEMVTGSRAFDGEDVAETLGAIIHKEPPWSALPAATPTEIGKLLQRCLEKDAKQRLRDIGDARLEIDSALRAPAGGQRAADSLGRSSGGRNRIAGWLLAGALAVVAGGVGFVHFTERPADPAPAVRFEIAAPPNTTLVTAGMISPDGRLVAFGARDDRGAITIWVRSLDSAEARPLVGTNVRSVSRTFIWSPDSRFIGYAATDGKLKKIEASGGAPQTLADLEGAAYRGGDWSRDGVVIFGLAGKGLRQVSAAGGTTSIVTTVDLARESSHVEPAFLPDGRRFLYTRLAHEREESGVYLGTLDARDQSAHAERLLPASSGTVFAPSSNPNIGQLLFVRGRTLMAQPFDAARGQPNGEAVPLAENMPDLGPRLFSASSTGVLTFRSVDAAAGSRLMWFDRQGKSLGELGPPASYGDVALAPDERTVVVSQREPQTDTPHVWIIDLQRQARSRLNPGDQFDGAPAISHDRRAVFTFGPLANELYIRSASGAGEPELLLKSANMMHPNDWSADGRFIMYDEHAPSRRQDLWVVPTAGDRKPIPFLTTPADEYFGQFSPDDRWVVYSSDESGRREVYIRDFAPDRVPTVGSVRITISTGGGNKPRWRPDGKEIYYIAPDGKMMAVPVKLGATIEPGRAVPLFDTNVAGTMSYDVTADGRFLVNTISEADASASSPITVVMNWQAQLKK